MANRNAHLLLHQFSDEWLVIFASSDGDARAIAAWASLNGKAMRKARQYWEPHQRLAICHGPPLRAERLAQWPHLAHMTSVKITVPLQPHGALPAHHAPKQLACADGYHSR